MTRGHTPIGHSHRKPKLRVTTHHCAVPHHFILCVRYHHIALVFSGFMTPSETSLCSLSSYSSGFQWFYDSFRNISSLAIQIISCKYRTNFSIYEHLSQKTSCLLSRVSTSVRRAVSPNSPRTIMGSRFAAGALKPILYAHILFRTLLPFPFQHT